MCDYSLMGMPNRLAQEGEVLVTHKFSTGSLGFASPKDLCKAGGRPLIQSRGFWSMLKENLFNPAGTNTVAAVCIPPGARLILQDIPTRLQRDLKVGPAEEVVFTRVTAYENTYRDAVRFRNGQQILLQKLQEGQHVKICDLSSAQALEPESESNRNLQFRLR
jgi:hypothetical protein